MRPRSQSSRDGRSCSLFPMCKITSGAEALTLVKPLTDSLDEPGQSQAGGARRDRTDDLMLAKHALSQLSYGPSLGPVAQACVHAGASGAGEDVRPLGCSAHQRRRPVGLADLTVRRSQPGDGTPTMVGLGRLERPTSPLSGVRSNHLSYRPDPPSTQRVPEKKKRRRQRPAKRA